MSLRTAVWILFLVAFAALLVVYAVGLAVSWDASDGSALEEAATIFVIAVLPGLVAAVNVSLVHHSRRALVAVSAGAAAAMVATVVVAALDHEISGLLAGVTVIVLLAVATTAAVALRGDAGSSMIWAASIALIVAVGEGVLTLGGAVPISAGLVIVAATTVNVARVQRLVPWWPIVAIIAVFVAATGGVALLVIVPIVVAVAVIGLRRRSRNVRQSET